jgi:acyl carrier protein
MSTKTTAPAIVGAFPKATVLADLTAALVDHVKSEAAIKGYAVPKTDSAIIKAAVQIDSLVTVDILCTVEPILGFELPENVVRTGGYRSIEAAVDHLMPRIQKQWEKKHGVKT